MSRFTLPTVSGVQRCDYSLRRRCVNSWLYRRPCSPSPDSPDPAMFMPLAKIHCRPMPLRNELRVLDPFAIKVHDIKSPVRPSSQIDGMKPGIGRGEKLSVTLRSLGHIRCAGWNEDSPMDQIRQWLTHKGIALVRFA